MTRFKIGQKLLVLFIAISLGPLVIVSIFLVVNAQNELRKQAVSQQQLAAAAAAERVDSFLGGKTNALIFQSQTSTVRAFDIPNASLNLAAMIKQDRDMERVALLDKGGMEKIVVNRDGLVASHANAATSDAFKAATFLAGKEYIGPVTYSDGKPHVTIAVPLIRFTAQQDLTHLSTAEFGQYRSPDDIVGVLTADFSLSDLWQSVLSTKIGKDGYAYVVDDKGQLIAHPDPAYLTAHRDVSRVHEVEDFLQNSVHLDESISETGQPVLASFKPIARTSWGVIVEEPTASVFAAVNAMYRLGIIILMGVTAAAVICSLVFRYQLLLPIQRIASGAMRIGRGDLRYKIPVRSNDELGDLAHSFNSMGGSLQGLVRGLQQKNQTLAQDHRQLSSILESVSDGVIAVNAQQEIISVNAPAARLIGKTGTELTGKHLLECFPLMRSNQAFALRLDKPGVYHYDDVLLSQRDTLHYLELVIVVQETLADVAAIITVHDLTQVRELEAMKVDFVAMAAHELRTPLTVIRGYLDLINSTGLSQMSIMNIENLQRALVASSQLGNLINNILNVSRIERGTMDVSLAKLDLGGLLAKIVKQQEVNAMLKQQRLRYEGPAEKLYAPADPIAIAEVVNNLLSNALKYTPSGGHITVKLERNGAFARVTVADNGRGIPPEARQYLFTKFYRVEKSLTAGNRGTGLGLYISKNIIELHEGEIGVSSQPGKGSTFFFTLPMFEETKHSKLITHTEGPEGIRGWFTKRSHR